MNAKELVVVYEPLWAAVPETRPDNHTPEFGDWIRSHVIEGAAAFVAAALCRVAAEDWLQHHPAVNGVQLCGEWLRVWWRDQGAKPSMPRTYWACLWDGSIWFYTDFDYQDGEHDTLVAACLAVHSASPSP